LTIVETLVVIGIIIVALIAANIYKNQKRREHLLSKYGDPAIVDKIIRKLIWQGMSKEQLVDSWGAPADIDDKVYKTKITQTFKYGKWVKIAFTEGSAWIMAS
jgi:Tfp pilus assembly major pilin PilA